MVIKLLAAGVPFVVVAGNWVVDAVVDVVVVVVVVVFGILLIWIGFGLSGIPTCTFRQFCVFGH